MPALTIVMYHYVRDLARSRYPEIKGLSVDAFETQLDHITRAYTVCTTRDVVAASRGVRPLPPRACLLTFDDGFVDHFVTVFPRLADRGLPASFYPPAAAVEGARMLDTHKIHFALATAPDHEKLARQVLDMVEEHGRRRALPSAATLYRRYAVASRFDGPDVVFVKRVLQRGLPEAVRADIVGRLFEEHVGVDESTFARELYMDLAQLRCLVRHGMEVGGHGAAHVWLDGLSREEQRREIAATVGFLARVHGTAPVDWVMCYPFGSHDAVTLELVSAAGGALGLTTRVGVAEDLRSPLELPRLDTNDLPITPRTAAGHG
jgi:peptidoglycan/xylan/chitin deacetylase (PgdA/CDA1 family)